MIVTTTDGVEGRQVTGYLGVVTGEAIMGTNVFRDMFAGIRDFVGGRSSAYEKEVKKAKDLAIEQMIEEAEAVGADAVVGVDIDYEVIGGDKKTLSDGHCQRDGGQVGLSRFRRPAGRAGSGRGARKLTVPGKLPKRAPHPLPNRNGCSQDHRDRRRFGDFEQVTAAEPHPGRGGSQ